VTHQASKTRTRVLVCDDSPAFVAAFRRVLEREGDIDVETSRVAAGVAVAARSDSPPDLIAIELDAHSGALAVIEEIMSTSPLPILVLEPASARGGGAAAARAAGALDTIGKDDVDLRALDGAEAAELRRRIKLLARMRVIRHPRGRLRTGGGSSSPVPSIFGRHRATHLAIAASTGGPPALRAVLGCLPATFGLPVLIVQHISSGFTAGLAAWLGAEIDLPVRIASDGERPKSGVWLAPEGAHMLLAPGGTLVLDHTTAPAPHRPAADVLFRSVAANVGKSAAAVVLSGMGADGAAGAAAVRAAGGITIAQDEATSAVFGMPRAAAEAGAEYVLALEAIGPALASLSGARA
jgi:two-component system chemotaxis response regulator CheB